MWSLRGGDVTDVDAHLCGNVAFLFEVSWQVKLLGEKNPFFFIYNQKLNVANLKGY